MKKFLNKPEEFVDDMIEGMLAAHPDKLKMVGGDRRCIVRADSPCNGKVAIASGGGSGHLPLFVGYVGKGILDGVSIGGVFQSPSADQMLEVTKAIHGGKGVLYVYGNYGGDIMNFDMAAEMAEVEDIRVESYVVAEDVASAPKGEESKRRGVAGMFYVFRLAGAMAEEGASLEEVKRIAGKTGANMRTMGVALSPVTVPEIGRPSFTIGDDEMEIGMGVHGEPGIRRCKILTADDVVKEMMDLLLPDLPFVKGNEVSVLMNGLGATPKEELYIAYRKVARMLNQQGIEIFKVYVGEFATSLEMAGMSITLLSLDEELKALLRKPFDTTDMEQLAF